MKFLSLFSGIGGFDLGLERAGMQCIGQVEYNLFCQQVLKRHWPHVKLIGNIRDVKENSFERPVDIICGGFPCQPFSFAGKRRGKEDDRYLWPEMLRVIKAYRPNWILGENVAGIVNMVLDDVLFDLESEGYKTQAFIIPACAVDAPHERKRVWIVAHPDGPGFRERRRPESIQPEQHTVECACKDVPDTINDGHDRAQGNASESSGDESTDRISERGHTWEPEPDVGGTLDGLSSWLDGFDMTISHKLYMSYAKTKNQRPAEVLRALRNSILSQGVQWPVGRSFCFSSSQILLSYLCKLEAQAADKAWLQPSGEEALESILRGMSASDEPASASYRPRQNKQWSVKHPDSLHALSSFLARHSEKAWVAYRRSDAYSGGSWENGIDRVAYGIPGRVDRLRSLGNAVVPQIVEEIGRSIMESERLYNGLSFQNRPL